MDKIDEKLSVVVDKLTKLVDVHGGDAVRLAIEVERWSAITFLVSGVLCLIGCFIAYRIGMKFYRLEEQQAHSWCDFFPYAGPCTVSLVLSGLLFIIGSSLTLHLWQLAVAIDPKLGLAMKIMRAAGM